MRIVVLDGHTLNPGDNPWDELAALGELTVHDPHAAGRRSSRARAAAEVVLTNKTVLDAAALAQLPALRFVGVLATGYNVVDVAAARARGITVSNVPEYGTAFVAQHVFALLLELAIASATTPRAVHAGDWQRRPTSASGDAAALELAGQTMGIVGYGRIGRRVARPRARARHARPREHASRQPAAARDRDRDVVRARRAVRDVRRGHAALSARRRTTSAS